MTNAEGSLRKRDFTVKSMLELELPTGLRNNHVSTQDE